MKKKYDMSVVVITYEADINKTINTLQSIIIQKNLLFEIIIADDGSKIFNQKTIIDFFNKNNFNNYCIIRNETNKGTVLNLLSGLYNCHSEYVKIISPGDYLYSETVLKECFDFLKQNSFELIFGRAVYYSLNENRLSIYRKSNPLNLKIYLKRNEKRILKEYLYYQDYVLGAAIICKVELLIKYLEKMKNRIKLLEDLAYALMIVDGVRLQFWNNNMIWYECTTGISHNSIKHRETTNIDISNCNKMICEKNIKYEKWCKIHYYENYNKDITFRIKRKIRKIILLNIKKIEKQKFDINLFNIITSLNIEKYKIL